MIEEGKISVYGAREHNLKNVDLEIPRNKLVVFTGLSGSGKSSLAFDTIYAEGQRRYLETFSAYARQFLGGLERYVMHFRQHINTSYHLEHHSFGGLVQLPKSTSWFSAKFVSWNCGKRYL